MSEWDVIGGDPAPGCPDAVGAAAAVLTKVSTMASDARQALAGSVGELDVSRWKGAAADAFRADIGALPVQLCNVAISYEEAASALTAYRSALQGAQQNSQIVRAIGEQAAIDAAQAAARQSQAQQAADGSRSQLNDAEYRRTVARRQLAVATDPVAQAHLQASLNAAQAAVNRHSADLQAAETARNRHAADACAARDQLARAVSRAAQIHADIVAAADAAAGLLARAERDAQLPTHVQQLLTDLHDGFVNEVGPAFVDSLKLGTSLFALAALVIPVGAPIFMGLAAACAIGCFVVSATVDSMSPGGLTSARLLDLGVQALTAAAMCIPGGGLLARGVGYAATAGGMVQGFEENGVKGAAYAAGGAVLGYGIGRVAGKVGIGTTEKVISAANKNPFLREQLQTTSRDFASLSHVTLLKVPLTAHEIPLVSGEQVRLSQSLLGTGPIGGGKFLPGNAGPHSTALDHALSSQAKSAQFNDNAKADAAAVTGYVADKLQEKSHTVSPPPAEIDINLPMRGSDSRTAGTNAP